MTNDSQLTSDQKIFIAMVSAVIDEGDIGKKNDMIWEKDHKYAKLAKKELSINLSDSELLQLARQGYVELYLSSTPKSIVFRRSLLELKTNEKVSNELQALPSNKMRDVDIIQMYVWLGASILFAVVAVILLVVTIDAILDQRISNTVASGIITLVTTIASVVFFRNYDKANDRLKRFRSNLSE